MSEKDILKNIDEKIKQLEKSLPTLKGEINCAALTLTSILDALDTPELKSFYFNNLAVPLAGGYGGFRSERNWNGPCGVINGGCAAIGIITGGKERLMFRDHMKTYQKAASFVHTFEKEFGSIECKKLSGTDFSDMNSITHYQENKIWENQCYKYVIFAIEQIKRITALEIKRKWQ
jgi:C_GCAxxG_C_C family probable redox protein